MAQLVSVSSCNEISAQSSQNIQHSQFTSNCKRSVICFHPRCPKSHIYIKPSKDHPWIFFDKIRCCKFCLVFYVFKTIYKNATLFSFYNFFRTLLLFVPKFFVSKINSILFVSGGLQNINHIIMLMFIRFIHFAFIWHLIKNYIQ